MKTWPYIRLKTVQDFSSVHSTVQFTYNAAVHVTAVYVSSTPLSLYSAVHDISFVHTTTVP